MKIMVNITTCFSLPSSGPMADAASPGLVAGLASGMGRPRAVGFHAVAFDLLADVATLPPSTKSLQARDGGDGGQRQRDFHVFF